MLRSRWIPVLLAVVLAVLFFTGLSRTSLYETDEGFAANRARSMVLQDTWLVVFDRVDTDEPSFKKPPMLYWMVRASASAFGWNMAAVRFPVALTAWLFFMLLYRLTAPRFGAGVAALGVLTAAVVPFTLLHARTAMLEFPLMLFVLGSVVAHAAGKTSTAWSLLAGLLGAAAWLTKGQAGLLAPVAALALSLTRAPWRRVWWVRTAAYAAGWAIPLALYLGVLPPAWRTGLLESLVIGEGGGRTLAVSSIQRINALIGPAREILGPLLPWAVAGWLWAVLDRVGRDRRWEWVLIGLLLCVPTALVGVRQAEPYPRYFLLVWIWAGLGCGLIWVRMFQVQWGALACAVAGLAATFTATTIEQAGVAALLLGAGAWRFAGGENRRGGTWMRIVGPLLLAVLLVTALVRSPSAYRHHPKPLHQPRPELARMVGGLDALDPTGLPLVILRDLKAHTVLFHSDRPVFSFSHWFLSEAAPGRVDLMAVRNDLRVFPEMILSEDVVRGTNWSIIRVGIDPACTPFLGGIISARRNPLLEAAFDRNRVMWGYHAHGYTLTAVPDDPAPPVSLGAGKPLSWWVWRRVPLVSVAAGGHVDVDMVAMRLLGVEVELAPYVRPPSLLVLEGRTGDGGWLKLAEFGAAVDTRISLRDGRVVFARTPQWSARFDPVLITALRVANGSGQRVDLMDIRVWSDTN
jgi:4-amino-4-deoxy-L-arabinose transferase-like glycosyltransferase